MVRNGSEHALLTPSGDGRTDVLRGPLNMFLGLGSVVRLPQLWSFPFLSLKGVTRTSLPPLHLDRDHRLLSARYRPSIPRGTDGPRQPAGCSLNRHLEHHLWVSWSQAQLQGSTGQTEGRRSACCATEGGANTAATCFSYKIPAEPRWSCWLVAGPVLLSQ